MSERDEKNRRLAEWVGWQINQAEPGQNWFHIKRPDGALIASAMLEFVSIHVPDFYRSEEASALLRDKILTMRYQIRLHPKHKEFSIQLINEREVMGFEGFWAHGDTILEAIAEAALLLAERGGQ